MTIHISAVCVVTVLVFSDLTIPNRVRTGERPYVSNVCDKSFARNFSLNQQSGSILQGVPTTVMCVVNHFIIRVLLIPLRSFILKNVYWVFCL